MFRLVNIVFFLNYISVLLANEPPKISIQQGDIQGGIGQTQHNRPYYYFTGIPYAKPPVGWYRFELASPAKPWNGTFDATHTPPVCLQYENHKHVNIIGDENCLYLNVYTPQLPNEEKTSLPVMFYIGGDHFDFNDASKEKIGPDLLLDKDVVLVTINYRLGVFGFFVTEDHTIPYNVGLKDQVQALKWVKKNIDNFGGDPNKITVFGNGAGGACAHYHMMSPLSKDLINGVITQSGTALNIWSYAPIQAVGVRSRAIAGVVNCPTQETNEIMIKCLKTVKAHDILNATTVLRMNSKVMTFKPALEQHRQDAFIHLDPIDTIKTGQAANVPFLSGITTENGAYEADIILSTPSVLEELNSQFEEISSWLLYYGMTAVVRDRIPIARKIKKFYFQDYSVNEGTRKELTNMYTDAWFLEGLRLSTEIHVKYSKKPVYNYLFGYKGSESYTKIARSKKNVASHKDELLHLFRNNADFPDYEPNESDKKMTELLVTLWTNFATYGNPTPPEDSSLSFKWEPVVKGEDNYLSIKSNGEIKMEQKMFSHRSDFWRSLSLDSRRDRIRDEL